MDSVKLKYKTIKDNIPFFEFGGNGETIHFAHANAYPPGSYLELINPLTEKYRVIGLQQRPLWPNSDPKFLRNWEQLSDDLIVFFEQQNLRNVLGIGHSLGAVVSLIAARKRPDLFRRLILLEPVLFPQYLQWIFKVVPINLRQRIIPVSRIANNRNDQWSDRKFLFDSYRKKRIFRDLSDRALNDWIDHGTKKNKDGTLQLAFPKKWESRIYATIPFAIDDLLDLKIPVHVLRGETTDVISPKVWKRIQNHLPAENLWELKNASHLVPLEYPTKVANWIMKAAVLDDKA